MKKRDPRDYKAGMLVKLSDQASIEGDKSAFGLALIMEDPEPDGHGGWRVKIKFLNRQGMKYDWRLYIEDLDILKVEEIPKDFE